VFGMEAGGLAAGSRPALLLEQEGEPMFSVDLSTIALIAGLASRDRDCTLRLASGSPRI